MKTIACLKWSVLMLFSVSISLLACKKENSTNDLNPQEEEQASLSISESDAESESIFNEVFDNVMGPNNDVGLAGTGVFGRTTTTNNLNTTERLTGCFSLSLTRLVQGQDFPLRIELDFGSGCAGRDGRVRAGKIITEYTGRLTVPGKSSVTTFQGYQLDSIKVEGTVKISNTGSSNLRQFTVDISNAKLTRPHGNYTKWNAHRVITQVEGFGTPEIYIDDVFTIAGNSSGEVKTTMFATSWESVITEPLRKRFACFYISKGILKIVRRNVSADSKWAAVLNYGNGTCDNKATLSVNGIEHQINLY